MALPAYTPDAALKALAGALAAADVELGPIKPGTRLTRSARHTGTTWEITYVGRMYGEPTWCLRGPGVEHGIAVSAEEVAAHITRPVPDPEPAPAPETATGAPRTHLGVPVPELVRRAWDSPLADGWRLGVRSSLAAS